VASASSRPTDDARRCDLCGEPLGVYEPLVEVDGERVRRTSRAASPELKCGQGVSCYHAHCFEERQNQQ
jgi:hypothetical protein